MKRIIFTVLLSVAVCSATFAQRFRVGLRAGTNIADYSLPIIATDDGNLRSDKSKMGFEAALAARVALTKHLNIQAEFEYDRLSYAFQYGKASVQRNMKITANRIEVPLLLGVDIGPLRLFAGPSFRIAHNEKSDTPSILQVKFPDSRVALTGGAALNIRKFFLEGRLTGYPRGAESTVILNGIDHKVSPRRDLKWSISAGVMF